MYTHIYIQEEICGGMTDEGFIGLMDSRAVQW